MKKLDVYQNVTDTIVNAIEQGLKGGFEMPWHQVTALPFNATTDKHYRGVNIPLLWAYQIEKGYKTATWATYKQWQDMGASVIKGQKAAPIVFWKCIDIEPSHDDEKKEKRMFARHFNVFNADQVEGYDPQMTHEPAIIESVSKADALIKATGADIRHDKNSAFYNVKHDYINVPCPTLFKETADSTATQNYYGTVFHELTHWTGAEHRLNRKKNNKFGDADYAFEELIAELGAAMCCALTGVEASPRQDHAQYIENWLFALRDDKKFIFSASSQAQKAVDYMVQLES